MSSCNGNDIGRMAVIGNQIRVRDSFATDSARSSPRAGPTEAVEAVCTNPCRPCGDVFHRFDGFISCFRCAFCTVCLFVWLCYGVCLLLVGPEKLNPVAWRHEV